MRRLTAMFVLNTILVAAQIYGGLVAHSTGLLADAGHNLADSVAVAGSIFAVHLATKPRDAAHSFGHHRATILAALASAALTAAVTAAVVIEAVLRLLSPRPVDGAVVVLVAGAAFVLDGAAALFLHADHHDLNMRATLLHFAADAAASLGVMVAGIVLMIDQHATWADPIAALLVAAVILIESYRLIRSSIGVLSESAPGDIDIAKLAATMAGVPGVDDVHDIHVWSLSSEVRALSAHIQVSGHPTLEAAQAIGEQVKVAVTEPFAIAHATIELECERCDDEVDPCDMDQLTGVRTMAGRSGQRGPGQLVGEPTTLPGPHAVRSEAEPARGRTTP